MFAGRCNLHGPWKGPEGDCPWCLHADAIDTLRLLRAALCDDGTARLMDHLCQGCGAIGSLHEDLVEELDRLLDLPADYEPEPDRHADPSTVVHPSDEDHASDCPIVRADRELSR